jgi:hypothetical protein
MDGVHAFLRNDSLAAWRGDMKLWSPMLHTSGARCAKRTQSFELFTPERILAHRRRMPRMCPDMGVSKWRFSRTCAQCVRHGLARTCRHFGGGPGWHPLRLCPQTTSDEPFGLHVTPVYSGGLLSKPEGRQRWVACGHLNPLERYKGFDEVIDAMACGAPVIGRNVDRSRDSR